MRSPDGGRLYAKYAVAERLGQTLAAIERMSEAEFSGWMAYFEIKAQKEAHAAKRH